MSGPVVETQLGKIRGSVERSIVGDDFCSFKGIPYAKPPLGQLRFADPTPAEPWSGIRDTTKFGPVCSQFDLFLNTAVGSEDCLYLNVYSKNINPEYLLPVMVWIHGGGFVCGAGDDTYYGPDYFMRKEVILVAINYRVGMLGFLNLEDEIAPGNQGLKDQVFALQWVRNNIRKFGGDPNNVTIFGESAGGASVHYLTISPLSKGLFHKAIIQSGAAVNPWACTTNPKKYAYKACEILGKKTKNHKEILEVLRTIDCKKLNEVEKQLYTPQDKASFIFPFGPGVDSKSKNPFMPVDPKIAANEGVQVPLIIGFNSKEGILFYEEFQKALYEKFHTDIEICLHPRFVDDLAKIYKRSPNDFKFLYFDDNDADNYKNEEKIAEMMGDVCFVEGIHKVVKIQVEKSAAPTYLYQYTYDKTPSPFKQSKNVKFKGATHADELRHLFRSKGFEQLIEPLQRGTQVYNIMEQMIEMWVNFAATGRPTPTITDIVPCYWLPVTNDTVLRHLNICENSRMEVILNLEQRYLNHQRPNKNNL